MPATGPERYATAPIVAFQAATMYLDRLFKLMAEKQASDLFISCGAPINIKINGIVSPGLHPGDGRGDGPPRRL